MSDYVSRLVARTLGTAAVVQPRLRSRFEPSGVVDVPAEREETALVARPAEEGAAAPIDPDHAVVAEPHARPPAPPPALESGAAAAPAVPIARGNPPALPLRRSADTRIDEPIAAAALQSPERPAVELDMRPGAPSAPAAPVKSGVRRAEPIPGDRVVEHLPPAASPMARETGPLVPARRSEVAAATTAPVPLPLPVPEADAEVRHVEPAIKVHIGRIEVRAVMSQPAPAPRPARVKPEPALGLKDYLEQRRKGRR